MVVWFQKEGERIWIRARWDKQFLSFPVSFVGYGIGNKTVRIARFGGKVLTDEKLLDFFNVPKLHPTHRWKHLLPISVSVPS